MLESPAYAFGPFRLIPSRRLVLRNGTPVPLTPKAFDTLVTLIERRDRVVSKEELLEHVWEGAAVEEGNLTQQIFLLRKALEEPGLDGRYIATIPRRGYRFVKEVELLPPPSETAWSPPVMGQRRSWRPWAIAVGIAAIALAAYVGRGLFERPDAGLTMVLTPMTREPGTESFPSFSPDGREFVYAVGPLDYFGEIDIYRRGIGLDRAFNLTPILLALIRSRRIHPTAG
jgi:DNA-binding winged helix-turn-helix (wHTH) protein